MNNNRITTTLVVATAALAAAAPATFGGPSLQAAAHFEAHANADTSAAKHALNTSAARARVLMARGTRELARAAAIVRQADAKAQASSNSADNHAVVDAQISLSTAAANQSATLQSISKKATGAVVTAARKAKAKVEAIRAQALAALKDSEGGPGVVSVSVTAGANSGSGSGDASASGSSSPQASGGIALLGTFSGGGSR